MLNWIVLNRASMQYFLPELVLSGVSMLVLLVAGFTTASRKVLLTLGILGIVAYLCLAARLLDTPGSGALFSGAIAIDSFALFFKLFFGVVTLITLGFVFRSHELEEVGVGEIVAFLMVLTVGMSMMAAATDLLMLYLSLETVSVLSYVLVGFKKHSRTSSEAGLKYILYGAASSGVMIFGLSYLFGLIGSTDIHEIAAYFRGLEGISEAPVVLFSLLAVMVGFGYKIAAFPTQMWCPDVYEGAPLPVTAFLSVGPKAAGFAMMIRFFFTVFGIQDGHGVQLFEFINWDLLVAIIAALTMTIGNLAALPQRNLKRLMAYSSIAHAGYLLMGFATLTSSGLEAILFYLVTYLLMNFGAFLVILIVGNKLGTEELDGYRGLGWRSPILGITLTVFLFSLTGLPPLAGFIGKVYLFAAVIDRGLYWLAVIGVINTVISLFYYVRVIKTMYLDSPLENTAVPVTAFHRAFALGLMVPVFVLGVYWEPLRAFAVQSVANLF